MQVTNIAPPFCRLRSLTISTDNAQHARAESPRPSSNRRASASPPASPKRSSASLSASTSRKASPLPDQSTAQPSTPGVGLWNTSWQRSLRSDSPSSDNMSPSLTGTAWIPLQTAQSQAEAPKSETDIPKATGSSHRSRRIPRDVLAAETNAVLEAEFRMMQHARHFASSEADAIHKEVCLCGLVSLLISAIFCH